MPVEKAPTAVRPIRRKSRLGPCGAAAVFVLAGLAPPAVLSADEPSYDLGLSLGVASAAASDARFDGAYDDSWAELGLELGIRWERWSLELAGAFGSTSGRDVLTLGNDAIEGTVRYEYHRFDLGVARSWASGSGWRLFAGAGPTAFAWREENPLLDREDTALGAHLLVGVERRLSVWSWRFALRYAHVPAAIVIFVGFDPVAS